MKFYVGTDHPSWLWKEPIDYPLFISHRALGRYKNFKPADKSWSLDSGGFTELNMFGTWETTPRQYVANIRLYRSEVGNLDWAAPQDWMCEPQVLQKTKKTVLEHQQLTIANFIELRSLAPELPIIPALQGWEPDDYLRHRDMYSAAGIDLTLEPVVGMGTFCRRASLRPVQRIVRQLFDDGLKMHGFGVKSDGLPAIGDFLVSADSMAWSFSARRAGRNLCGVPHKSPRCHHCRTWATMWADRTTSRVGSLPVQMELGLYESAV
jgi:hypothetical protein